MGFILTLRRGLENRHRLFKKFYYLFILSIIIIGIRVFLPTEKIFIFFFWNMFLAIVPLFLSTYILELSRQKGARWTKVLIGFLWLIFFPNAPYVFTDFRHIQSSEGIMLVIDFLTILYFAIWAFVIAIVSLNDIMDVFRMYVNKWIALFLISIISALSVLGIYLGRDLRLNSWDVFIKPFTVIENSFNSIYSFNMDLNTWLAALLISLAMLVGVIIYHFAEKRRKLLPDKFI